jgi:hypothetical protein
MNPTDARDTIVKEIAIKVPADRIFEALTNPEQRLKWWGADGPLDALGSASESSRDHHRGWPQVLAWLRAYVE